MTLSVNIDVSQQSDFHSKFTSPPYSHGSIHPSALTDTPELVAAEEFAKNVPEFIRKLGSTE